MKPVEYTMIYREHKESQTKRVEIQVWAPEEHSDSHTPTIMLQESQTRALIGVYWSDWDDDADTGWIIATGSYGTHAAVIREAQRWFDAQTLPKESA